MKKIKIAIIGYGNLGKGVEKAITQTFDMQLFGIFTRRDPKKLNHEKMFSISDILKYKNDIDICILCGGSKDDLFEQTLNIAKNFNTVDAFDNHKRIPEYFDLVDKVAKENKNLSLISTGWDPGLFSLNRVLFDSIFNGTNIFSFWGEGVSQGHSDAIRRIKGVKHGVQYTIPNKEIIKDIKNGKSITNDKYKMHKRICYIVKEKNSDEEKIKSDIKNMKDYFLGYDTDIYFIEENDFFKNHKKMNHAGCVIGQKMLDEDNFNMEFSLKMDSNPFFTASVCTAFARAVYKLSKIGTTGAITVFDIPIGLLSPMTNKEIIQKYL